MIQAYIDVMPLVADKPDPDYSRLMDAMFVSSKGTMPEIRLTGTGEENAALIEAIKRSLQHSP